MSSNSVSSSAPHCTICLSDITAISGRSTATLSCGHLFHLDCIGTHFNFHSSMECPNCNNVEEGSWQFAAGGVEAILGDDENDNNVERHPPQQQLPQYYMPYGFPNLPPQMIRNPQPTAPGSIHPAFVPGITQLRQNGWAPQPQYVPISSSLSFTLTTSQGFEVRPTLGYPSHPNLPYHVYIPAPGGHAVGSSSQPHHQAALPSSSHAQHQGHLSSSQARHQPRSSSSQARHQAHPPRNGWPIVRNVQIQQQQPSASAAAQAQLHRQASGPTSHGHGGIAIGTSMGQGAQPSFYNQGSGTRVQPFRPIMGYYANMMHGTGPEPSQNENNEDGVPTMHRFL